MLDQKGPISGLASHPPYKEAGVVVVDQGCGTPSRCGRAPPAAVRGAHRSLACSSSYSMADAQRERLPHCTSVASAHCVFQLSPLLNCPYYLKFEVSCNVCICMHHLVWVLPVPVKRLGACSKLPSYKVSSRTHDFSLVSFEKASYMTQT